MPARSFEEILADLLSLKEELLRLHYAYSPAAVNFHQIKHIDSLKQQVKLAHDKLSSFQAQYLAKKQSDLEHNKSLQEENSELLSINEQLVVSNEKFKKMMESTQQKKEELQRELERERQGRRTIQSKYQKQIENLKLMQAQQLYMLRKKEKRS